MAAMNGPDKTLRLITYLSPSAIPLGCVDLIRDYLETKLGVQAYIIYESRWSGPPSDRVDPFTANIADMAFMCSTAYLQLVENGNDWVELCHAAAVPDHPQSLGRPLYFADVIINTENSAKFKDFEALKGCRWAFNDDISLSGNLMVLAQLKKKGYNASFFGNILRAGSHVNSIQMVLDQQADAASIDSNVLASYKRTCPERAEQLTTLVSFGPMPIQPVVLSKRLPASVREGITQALLDMHSDTDWGSKLQKFGFLRYTPINETLYNLEAEIKELVAGLSIAPRYY